MYSLLKHENMFGGLSNFALVAGLVIIKEKIVQTF